MVVSTSNGITIGSAAFAQVTTECSYTLQWAAPFPLQNCPFLCGDLDSNLIHGSLGPPGCANMPIHTLTLAPREYDWTCVHWRRLANTIEHVLPSAHPSPQPKRKPIGSAVFAQFTAEGPYTLQWARLSAKIAPSHGGPGSSSNFIHGVGRSMR